MRFIVQIHGLDQTSATDLRERIFRRLNIAPALGKETRVELCCNSVTNEKGESRPFFRVMYWASSPVQARLIANRIKELDPSFDVLYTKLEDCEIAKE